MVRVRELSTGRTLERWPVDARELIASGEFEPADTEAQSIAQGVAAFPFVGKARATAVLSASERPASPEVPSAKKKAAA